MDFFKFGTLIRHILAYPYLTFGDIQVEFEGIINYYIVTAI